MRSYAQQAEDVRLARVFRDRSDGFYIDVGAAHPVHDSVTKYFYDAGWTGIDIEPSAAAAALLRQDRPRNLVLELACSNAEGEATLYDTDVVGWATLDADMADHVRSVRAADATARRVPVRTLTSICAEHVTRQIDFLKVDVEGHEAAVLRGADFTRWRPAVVVVEATKPHTTAPTHHEWEGLLTDAGYVFAAFDGINRFYVPTDRDDLRTALEPPVTVLDGWETHRQMAADEAAERLQGRVERLESELESERGRRVQAELALDDRRRRSLAAPPALVSASRSSAKALRAALARLRSRAPRA
jgi:FkbM family methyltransferase